MINKLKILGVKRSQVPQLVLDELVVTLKIFSICSVVEGLKGC